MPSEPLHYLILTCGSTGDIYPFMPLALALQALGRRVTFVANSVHSKQVQDAGLHFVGFGTDEHYQSIIKNPDIWHPRRAMSVLFADSKNQLIEVNALIRSIVTQAPTVIIAHPLAVPSAAIAKEHGLVAKIVAMPLAPSSLRTCYDPLRIGGISIPKWVPVSWRKVFWWFVEWGWVNPVVLAQTNAARKALGLQNIHSYLGHIAQVPDLTVTLFPAWYSSTKPDWPRPMLNADFQLFDAAPSEPFSPELQIFLTQGTKPIVFTPGTANIHARNFFASALSAVEQLGERAIFLTKDNTQLPANLPHSVLWQAYVPLVNVLPEVKALVHHGGIGTTAEAFRAATPQLVTPFAWDQFDNAARVEGLGVGTVLKARSINARRMTNTLRRLLASEEVKQQCQKIAQRFHAKHNLVELCQRIEAELLSR